MTNLEHYVENAICFLENGGEYKDFFEDKLLKHGEEQTGISLKAMWEIAQYITCAYKPWLENICTEKLIKLYGYEVEE